jgi:hypothetical protein
MGAAGPLPAAFLTVGPMKIEQMGAVVRSNGDFLASARCLHDGGANGEIRSSRLRLTYTFYAGASENASLAGAAAVWQTTRSVRVYAARPEPVTVFLPGNPLLKQSFPVITHVVVQAEFLVDK